MKSVFPVSGRQLFDGGLNNKYQRSIIDDNESPVCQNVVFDNGGVETRYGSTKLNSTRMASAAVDGLYTRNERTGAQSMIAFCNGLGYTWTGVTFSTIPSAQSVFTAGQRVCGAEYENHIFFSTGGTIPYKYNGTDFTRHGVYPPTATHTVATAPTGTVLTGGYQYRVTQVNSQSVQSDMGPVNTTITVAAQNVRLTAIPVAPQSYGVSARRIYRTAAGGATFKLLATLSDNTTTTYDDGVADASLGVTGPTDNGVPPNYIAIVEHQNRLFMITGTDNLLWYTEWGEPYTVASVNFRPMGDDSGDIPKGLSIHNDMVVVTGEKNHYFLYMPDPTDDSTWQDRKSQSGLGSYSRFALPEFDNKMLLPAVENKKFVGFATVSGFDVEKSATFLTVATAGSKLTSDRVEPDMILVQSSYLSNISAIVYKSKVWIALTYNTGSTTNNRVYQYDFNLDTLSKRQRGSWVPFTGTPFNVSQFTIYDGKIYAGTSEGHGFVYQLDDGTYNDDSTAIDSYYWTKEFSGLNPDFNFTKDFRDAFVLIEKSGSYFMNFTYRVDSDEGVGTTTTINLDPGGSLWGSMEWGADVWGGGTAEFEAKVGLGSSRGKRIQFKFSNQEVADQKFRVAGMNFTYNKKGLR